MKKIILSVAFLGLGVFGFAQQTTKANHTQRKAEYLQKMKQELNLTDTQVAQLKDLHAKKAADRKQEMSAKKEDRMQKMKQNEADMQKILTPDQFNKYKEIKAKKMAERKDQFKATKKSETAVVN